jgi:hypothetical protein
VVGARATSLFPAAYFAKKNTNSVGVQSEGEAERGVGEFHSARAEAKPPTLLVQCRVPQKKFCLLIFLFMTDFLLKGNKTFL